ncbi:MAG: hypothetical protein LBF36_03545 [Mycoplasmataceae bacterium]|jgi:Xaa-Pro aminopeptidase|nr:hypothetical protein [Mycoplasmataceae bacterium]
MKTAQNITIAEIQQKLEVIEIQIKLLFKSYKDFISHFLTWRLDDPKQKDYKVRQKLIGEFKLILRALDDYLVDIENNVKMINEIANKVRATKSPSMIKTMEHSMYKADKVLLRCNTYTFLIDQSHFYIASVMNIKRTEKRVLN